MTHPLVMTHPITVFSVAVVDVTKNIGQKGVAGRWISNCKIVACSTQMLLSIDFRLFSPFRSSTRFILLEICELPFLIWTLFFSLTHQNLPLKLLPNKQKSIHYFVVQSMIWQNRSGLRKFRQACFNFILDSWAWFNDRSHWWLVKYVSNK